MQQSVRRVHPHDDYWDASLHLDEVHREVVNFDVDPENVRCLSTLDLFGGSGNFSKECTSREHTSLKIDIECDMENHNILTRRGFFFILTAILAMQLENA